MNDPAHGSPLADPRLISEEDRLLSYLHERDEPCPLCEYNLRNLTSSRCPECGQLLKLSVTQAEPYLKAWIAAVVPLCAGTGLGLMWLLLIMRLGAPNRGFIGMVTQILLIPFAPWVIIRRRQFLRKSRQSQWVVASLAIVVVVGSFIAVMLTLR